MAGSQPSFPSQVTWAAWICTCEMVGADLSSLTGLPVVLLRVRGRKFCYFELYPSLHQTCTGYSAVQGRKPNQGSFALATSQHLGT